MKWQNRNDDPAYRLKVKQNEAAFRATTAIEVRMAELEMSRADIAKALKRSRAWISKLLHGGQNLTLFTLVEVAEALQCDVELALKPRVSEAVLASHPAPRKAVAESDPSLSDPSLRNVGRARAPRRSGRG